MDYNPSAPECITAHKKTNSGYTYDIGYPDLEDIMNKHEQKFELRQLSKKINKIKYIYKYVAELSLLFEELMYNKFSEKIVFKQEYFDGFYNAFKDVFRISQYSSNKFFTNPLYTLQKSETIVYYPETFEDSKEYIIEKITIKSFFKRFVYILNTLAYSEKNGEIGILGNLHVIGDKVYDFCQTCLKDCNNDEVRIEVTIFMNEIEKFTDQFIIIETLESEEIEVLKKYIVEAYSIIRKITVRQKKRERVKIFDNDFYSEDYNDYKEAIKLVIISSDNDKKAYFTELMYVISQEGHTSKVDGVADEKVNVEIFFRRLNRIQTKMIISEGISLKTLEELKKIFIKIDSILQKYLKDGTYPDALILIRQFCRDHQQCTKTIVKKIKKKKKMNFISKCI